MANMTSGLAKLLRSPSGCFEQTSSTNYPLAMALKYFQTHKDVDLSLVSGEREEEGREGEGGREGRIK
jgi:hypothetical protein